MKLHMDYLASIHVKINAKEVLSVGSTSVVPEVATSTTIKIEKTEGPKRGNNDDN